MVSRYWATPGAIGRAELVVELRELFHHGIEQAGPASQGGAAFRRGGAVAEEPLEHDPRMRLARQRRRRRGPREIVLIDAGVAVVALAGDRQQIHGQFERGELRAPADLLGGDLIGGGSQVIVRAFREPGPGGAQECGVGGRVRAGIGVAQLQVADDRDVVLDRRQRGQRGRKLVETVRRRAASSACRRSPSGCRHSRGGADAAERPASGPGRSWTGIMASSSGNASAAPAPRRKVRRDSAFLVTIIATSSFERVCWSSAPRSATRSGSHSPARRGRSCEWPAHRIPPAPGPARR